MERMVLQTEKKTGLVRAFQTMMSITSLLAVACLENQTKAKYLFHLCNVLTLFFVIVYAFFRSYAGFQDSARIGRPYHCSAYFAASSADLVLLPAVFLSHDGDPQQPDYSETIPSEFP